jgi:hypothetical protein
MPDFRIAIDLSRLMPPNGAFDSSVFPALAQAVQSIIDAAEAQWKAYATGAPLPSGKSIGIRSGQYNRSIMQRKTGDFSGEVFSELAYADTIERGTPARDLKDMLRYSLKVRISQRTGRRYLIIPFRHSENPNNVMRDNPMPQAVVNWWIDRARSAVISGHERRPVHSDIHGTIVPWHAVYDIRTRNLLTVPQRRYQWGARLTKAELEGLGADAKQIKRMAGMVNFRRPAQKGGASHSQYITFRTMSEGSPGWKVPARAGYWPARTTADKLRPVAEQLFRAAVEEDIRQILPGAQGGASSPGPAPAPAPNQWTRTEALYR